MNGLFFPLAVLSISVLVVSLVLVSLAVVFGNERD